MNNPELNAQKCDGCDCNLTDQNTRLFKRLRELENVVICDNCIIKTLTERE